MKNIKSLFSEKDYIAYKIGALLYTPAINTSIAEKIENNSFEKITSIAICLEDSILDTAVNQAEENLLSTLKRLSSFEKDRLPLIFIRIRTPDHLLHIHSLLGKLETIITGYILPKFDASNLEAYRNIIVDINQTREKSLYFMPILESEAIARVPYRFTNLIKIKEGLEPIKEYILNIRVGGNDLCNLYGVRRSMESTIYDIGVVRDVLIDIINVFGTDYIVSGPVWEYFGDKGKDWENGLKRELCLDKLNGFVGKTAIHPSQIPIICNSLAVSQADYDDAVKILDWDNQLFGVQASADKSRMNEVKCHSNWAKKILILSDIYGID